MTTEVNFKDSAELAGIAEEIVAKLGEEWPGSVAAVAKALKDAGHPAGKELIEAATLVHGLRPEEPKTQPAQAPSLPTNITVRTGKPDDMTLSELVTAVAGGERGADYVSALRARVGSKSVFVRVEGGEGIDVTATLELIDYVGDDAQAPEFWGNMPTETLDEILERRHQANPITGEKLAKGDAWTTVAEDRRVLAAYARIGKHLKGNEDEQVLIRELKEAELSGRWPRIQAAFNRDEKAHNPTVDQARAAIYYRKEVRPSSGQPFRSDRLDRTRW